MTHRIFFILVAAIAVLPCTGVALRPSIHTPMHDPKSISDIDIARRLGDRSEEEGSRHRSQRALDSDKAGLKLHPKNLNQNQNLNRNEWRPKPNKLKPKPQTDDDDVLEKEHATEEAESKILDMERIEIIKKLPKSTENRYVAFSLYGVGTTRYTVGAIENAKIVNTYFPGWKLRFYLTGPVDEAVLDTLKDLGAELVKSSASMFARFLIADDPTVDRYLVRDADSRLSSRDRLATEEWIQSGKKFSIMRDHMNHCHPMNGGNLLHIYLLNSTTTTTTTTTTCNSCSISSSS
jgi:hypothetical protein